MNNSGVCFFGAGLMSPELVKDELFHERLHAWILQEHERLWEIDSMIWEYELINGEGSYEQFIFGGAPGL